MRKIHGNGGSDIEDLAFTYLPPREADEIGRRVCLSTRESIGEKNEGTRTPGSR